MAQSNAQNNGFDRLDEAEVGEGAGADGTPPGKPSGGGSVEEAATHLPPFFGPKPEKGTEGDE